ncbi:MAG TPA: hypothetical protein VE011_00835 [Candidatus Dormibacteraeota bacterium]|nr:hypothetical protein [Candidatus Dormibacteraeota bacterium]
MKIDAARIDVARLALVTALLLALHSGEPTAAHVLFLVVVGAVLAAATRWPVGLATIGVLLLGAIVIRIAISDRTGSDVLDVTRAAIDRVLAGLNPYGYAYKASTPPGAPFPYGPLAILVYLPFHDAAWVLELVSAGVVLGILAFYGRLMGLAVYAVAPIVVAISVDGSNDTTLGLMILLAFMPAKRWPAVAAFVLALATGFKLSALAFVPGFLAWAGLRVALVFAAGTVIAWSPVIGNWGIASYLDSVDKANVIHVNRTTWSLGVLVKWLTGARQPIMDTLKYAFGAAIAIGGLRFRRSLDGVILVGVVVYLVTLYGGNWGSYAYFGGIAPVVCWRLDDWLGFASVPMADRLRALRDQRAARNVSSVGPLV